MKERLIFPEIVVGRDPVDHVVGEGNGLRDVREPAGSDHRSVVAPVRRIVHEGESRLENVARRFLGHVIGVTAAVQPIDAEELALRDERLEAEIDAAERRQRIAHEPGYAVVALGEQPVILEGLADRRHPGVEVILVLEDPDRVIDPLFEVIVADLNVAVLDRLEDIERDEEVMIAEEIAEGDLVHETESVSREEIDARHVADVVGRELQPVRLNRADLLRDALPYRLERVGIDVVLRVLVDDDGRRDLPGVEIAHPPRPRLPGKPSRRGNRSRNADGVSAALRVRGKHRRDGIARRLAGERVGELAGEPRRIRGVRRREAVVVSGQYRPSRRVRFPGLPAELVHHEEIVTRLAEGAHHEPVLRGGIREREDAAENVRESIVVPRLDAPAVEIAAADLVGGEQQLFAARQDRGIPVLAGSPDEETLLARAPVDAPDVAVDRVDGGGGGEIDVRESDDARAVRRERRLYRGRGRSRVGDPRPVGKPRRGRFVGGVVGDSRELRRRDPVEIEIDLPARHADERDRLAVGRPRRAVEEIERKRELRDHPPPGNRRDEEPVEAAGFRDECDAISRRTVGEARVHAADRFEPRGHHARDEPLHDLAGERVHEVDAVEPLAIREIHELLAVRGERRLRVHVVVPLDVVREAASVGLRLLLVSVQGPVTLPDRFLPVSAELGVGDAERILDRAAERAAAEPLQNLDDLAGAVRFVDVADARLPRLVRHVSARILEIGQVIEHRGVPHEHIAARLPTDGIVFGETLGEPERNGEETAAGEYRFEQIPVHDVEGEDVHELVNGRVGVPRARSAEVDHDSPAGRLAEAEHSFGEQRPGHVRLLKIRLASVDDHGNPPADLVREIPRELLVSVFEHESRSRREIAIAVGEMDVEMGRSQDLPFEIAVLDLVLAEPAGLREGRRGVEREQRDGRDGGDGRGETRRRDRPRPSSTSPVSPRHVHKFALRGLPGKPFRR